LARSPHVHDLAHRPGDLPPHFQTSDSNSRKGGREALGNIIGDPDENLDQLYGKGFEWLELRGATHWLAGRQWLIFAGNLVDFLDKHSGDDAASQ
jgi:hypothetical protein